MDSGKNIVMIVVVEGVMEKSTVRRVLERKNKTENSSYILTKDVHMIPYCMSFYIPPLLPRHQKYFAICTLSKFNFSFQSRVDNSHSAICTNVAHI